jgi:hypothetical protein
MDKFKLDSKRIPTATVLYTVGRDNNQQNTGTKKSKRGKDRKKKSRRYEAREYISAVPVRTVIDNRCCDIHKHIYVPERSFMYVIVSC